MLDLPSEWDRARPPPHVAGAAATPGGERAFVGRENEMAGLKADFEASLAGEGQTILISGEAGVGKTRLASEFTIHARASEALVLWGRCWEAGGAPSYWPWIEVLRQTLGSEHLPLNLAVGRHGAYLAELVPELAERLPAPKSDAPPPRDPESARFLMFDAIGRLLRALATSVPLVVVIDDLHAADRASLLLLGFLARTLRDAKVLLVATYRDPEAFLTMDVAQPLAEIGRQSRQLSLFGLPAPEVGHLIHQAAGQAPSDALVSRIHRITDGNPFFVDEIVRLLASEGRFDLKTDSQILARIPDGIREAVRRRLSHLGSDSASVLEVAAVIGREFDIATVCLATTTDHLELLDALERPMRHGLIVETAAHAGRFQFRHALIREVIYESIPATHRLLIHRRVGEAIELLSESQPDRYVAELAHHFLVAAPCAGSDGRFAEYASSAARRALSRMAFEEAVVLHQRTLDVLPYAPPDERRKCRILLALGEAREWANDPNGSREAFEQAAAIARRLGASDLLVEAALGVGAVQALKFTAIARCESAPDLLREALDTIGPDDLGQRARLLSRLALDRLRHTSREDALRLSEAAVTTARLSGDSWVLATSLIARNAVIFSPEFLQERAAIARELLAIGRERRDRGFTMRGHALEFTVQFELGDIQAADEALDAHRRLAEATGDPIERWANLVWHAERVLLEGRFDEADSYARKAFDFCQNTPGPHTTELYGSATYAGQTILIQETRDEAFPDISASAHFRSSYPEVSAWRIVELARLTRAGRADLVATELNVLARGDFLDIEPSGSWLATMSYLCEAVELVGDQQRARSLYDLLLPFAEQNVTVHHVAGRGSVSRWLGLVATTLSRWDLAEVHFQKALTMNLRMGARPYVANTCYDYGRLLAEHGGIEATTRAGDLLRTALGHATDLGMSGLAARCERALIRLSSLTDTAAPAQGHPRVELRKQGQVWLLAYSGTHLYLKDAKGLTYIAELLRYPGKEIHALDLLALVASADGATHATPTSDPVIDGQAQRAYEARLDALMSELEQATAYGDPEQALILRREITSLRNELARGVGYGRRRRVISAAERARVSVTRTIRLAVARIAEANGEIGADLSRSIRTGTYCSYMPPGLVASGLVPGRRPSSAESAPTHAPPRAAPRSAADPRCR
jgi:tetratricopeptide (TPR) repeat protein